MQSSLTRYEPMSNWLEDTYRRLAEVPRWITLSQIAQDTGLQVSWVSAFAAKKIEEPGIVKTQRLHEYLSNIDKFARPSRMNFAAALEIDPHTEESSGVYIVYAGNVCLYVGSSKQIFKRLRDHARKRDFMAETPTHVDLQFIGDDAYGNLRRSIERARIKALKPKFNVMGAN